MLTDETPSGESFKILVMFGVNFARGYCLGRPVAKQLCVTRIKERCVS